MSRTHKSFDSSSTAQAWNSGAVAWDEFVESGNDCYRLEVHGPGLLGTCGDVAGLRALDLGCGQGYFARQLARGGAKVTGIDLSKQQIENARRHESEYPLGIDYLVMDTIRVDDHWPVESFDLITACMALHDMPEPDEALRSAGKVLKKSGRLVLSTPHPCTDTPYREWERDESGNKVSLKIDLYFQSGVGTTRWNMAGLSANWETSRWYHTLTRMSEMFNDAGFMIRRLAEPRPTGEQVRQNPDLEDCFRLPYFLIFDLVTSTY